MEIKIKRNWEFKSKIDPEVTYKVKYLTTGELEDCYIVNRVKKQVKIETDIRKMLEYAVTAITGLSVVDEDTEKKSVIDTIDKLLNTPGLTDYYYELYAEVPLHNARVDSKNS